MYVAVKGGEKAIDNAHALLAEERRGDVGVPELTLDQIKQQMGLAVDRVMGEGSLYDPDLAALAIKQAQGDLVEAVFLLRAFRTTLPRLAVSTPVDTAAMTVRRRSRICRGGRCWARPMITLIACSTSPWRREHRYRPRPRAIRR